MADRELLELAAKAAGKKIDKSPYNGGGQGNTGFDCMGRVALDWHNGKFWDPLGDDGDALRLAVKLGIKVMPYPVYDSPKHSVCASRRSLAPPDDDENTYVGPDCIEVYGSDPYAATRRAIVRAAAEIGRSGEKQG